jgi:hypothetical protein
MKFKNRMKIVGKELLQGNFGNAFSTMINPGTYKGGGSGDFWWFGPDGHDVYFDYSGNNSSLTAYARCPPLNAIINRKAQAFLNGKTWVLNASGEDKGKEATSDQANLLRLLFVQA